MTKKTLYLTFLLFLSAPAFALELYYAKERTVAYENPSQNSPLIYRFQPGEEFKVIGKEKGEWLKEQTIMSNLREESRRGPAFLLCLHRPHTRPGPRELAT